MKSKTRSELQLQPRRSSAFPGGRLATQNLRMGCMLKSSDESRRFSDSRRVSDMLPSQSTSLFVVTSSHWTDISCVWFVWAPSIFELDVKGDIQYECDRAANRRLCGVLRSGNHCCLLAHGN